MTTNYENAARETSHYSMMELVEAANNARTRLVYYRKQEETPVSQLIALEDLSQYWISALTGRPGYQDYLKFIKPIS